MRRYPIPLMAALFSCLLAGAQQQDYTLQLKSGAFVPERNITDQQLTALSSKAPRIDERFFLFIQFEKLPDAASRERLKKAGIDLQDYITGNAFTAVCTSVPSKNILEAAGVRALILPEARQKMDVSLQNGLFPSYAVTVPGTVDVAISFPEGFSWETVRKTLTDLRFDILSTDFLSARLVRLRVAALRVQELASLPCIEYVQPALPADRTLNNSSRANSKATVLQSSTGRNLKGQGVVIGVGDDADPLQHADIQSHLINRSSSVGNWHGIHVMGTTAGSGIIDERYTGYAPEATIVAQTFSNILTNTPAYVKDYGMVITNNSYGNIVDDCNSFGKYDLYSRVVDQQINSYPALQHVFGSGNSGTYTCSPYATQFSNVLGAYQSAKNVITVGNTTSSGMIANNSSRGPVRDGRIKPEVMAQGTLVMSTVSINIYGTNSGTSMASPAVAGGLALLYQRYRQLHGNANPRNGLMKALICNGAADLGNPGPDYRYGFGWMDLQRSVLMLEANNYQHDSLSQGDTKNITFNVPAGLAQLKVMLYWNDPAASVLANPALVHDLDLEVITPSVTMYPQLLDTVPSMVNNVALTGPDHVNNIEQVVINAPVAGTYTFVVKGTRVTQSPRQDYFLVYDTLPVVTRLTYPVGGEYTSPGDVLPIAWDSYGLPANTFTVEYTTDGITWNVIDAAVPADIRRINWTVPSVVTSQAQIRVTRNSTAMTSTGGTFSIIGTPVISMGTVQCESYINIDWTAVAGATAYELFIQRGNEMVSVATVPPSTTTYSFSGLSRDSLYCVTVRANFGTFHGRRARAASALQPSGGTCSGNISDNDLKMVSLRAPSSGRQLTATALTAATPVTVRIKNLDDAPVASLQVRYYVNGVLQATETPAGLPLAGQATLDHTFTTTYNFSAAGDYDVKAEVVNLSASDPVAANDTITQLIRQLPNAPVVISLGNDFTDNIEAADSAEYIAPVTGLRGAGRYDLVSSTAYGRVRTFVNSGIANGQRGLTLDADRFNGGGTADSLKGTFNLAGYNATTQDIRLDFLYKHHGQLDNNANRVWVRGSDLDPWIQVYDLYANQSDPGVFRRSSSLEVSDALVAAGQAFTSSFQVRWGQWGQIQTADNENAAGYTLDDVHFYIVANDMQMVSIDTPVVASCGLDNNVPVRIRVRNSVNTAVTDVPVRYQVDAGGVVNGTIASIPGNGTAVYQFPATADLSAPGTHTVKAWVDFPGDTYRDNDTVIVTIINSPVITTFPHLQNFETGDGGWYTGGKKSSWEYGTPASTKISRAASGAKAWKTRLAGNYNDGELSYLYSPCYDVTGMTAPTLSMHLALDAEDCGNGSFCDGAWMEYSINGVDWQRLGAVGEGTNWYNRNYPANPVWSIQDYTRWHVATIPLPTGVSRLRLRMVMNSDPYVNREGVGIDDIHIYDNTKGIYDGITMAAPTPAAAVSGNNWIDFTENDKLVASVNANGLTLGNTTAQAYIHTGNVRNNNGQYYHNRNITVKPVNTTQPDSAIVRFYFLDTETEALIAATGCGGCTKPAQVVELGVSKFTHTDKNIEDGDIDNNTGGEWLFIAADRAMKVPFDKGYYAEFNVRNFSEFWLNNGGPDRNTPLPVQLLAFNAIKTADGKNAELTWSTAAEVGVTRFEIQVAKGNEALNNQQFVTLGFLPANGAPGLERQYNYTDGESNKSGVRYYRLKIAEADGSFTYSDIRPVVFNAEMNWQLYPNPSAGEMYFVYQAEAGSKVPVRIFDATGRVVKQTEFSGNGFIQKQVLVLPRAKYPAGLYLVEAGTGKNKSVFRIMLQ
ncbi:S8 family serine peptidase [Terrimonas ferruginea]|uniref:S8 family serine peptidase n=1 Tax=Terrimonas ferruginea TaxID=249 RepID=UPI00048B3ACE|nr:S8 family serine peptidase [Terrimonas ferruginea]